jgi:hypothetical protein
MKDFHAQGGRVKLMVVKKSAVGALPSLGRLKKEFCAQQAHIYKSWGRHSHTIQRLINFSYYASGSELSIDERQELCDGVYVCFDVSAKLNLASFLRYSEKVHKYYDLRYEDYRKALSLVGLLGDTDRVKWVVDYFCSSMASYIKILKPQAIKDDAQQFDAQKFKATYANYGVNARATIQDLLTQQCDKLTWNVEASVYQRIPSTPTSDQDDYLKAA